MDLYFSCDFAYKVIQGNKLYNNFFYRFCSMTDSQLKPTQLESLINLNTKSTNNTPLVHIENRFFITTLKYSSNHYNAYNGVDVKSGCWVVIYLKAKNAKWGSSSKIKEEVRHLLAPKVIWEGHQKLNEGNYYCQVHERSGPSFRRLFSAIKESISPKQLLHLLFQLIKLLEKLSTSKLACGELSPDNIYFDSNPNKTDLLLLNCFNLKHRNQKRKPYHTKFCSRGSHLGRNLHIKDDLQSIVYILIDLFIPNTFLQGVHAADYQQRKSGLRMQEFSRKFPEPFLLFYYDVIGLNLDQDFNFFYWKNYLARVLTSSVISQPYHWMNPKSMIQEDNNLVKPEMVSVRQRKEIRQSIIDIELCNIDCSELEQYPDSQNNIEEARRSIMSSRRIKKNQLIL